MKSEAQIECLDRADTARDRRRGQRRPHTGGSSASKSSSELPPLPRRKRWRPAAKALMWMMLPLLAGAAATVLAAAWVAACLALFGRLERSRVYEYHRARARGMGEDEYESELANLRGAEDARRDALWREGVLRRRLSALHEPSSNTIQYH